MHYLVEITKQQLVYCCLVSDLDDWHHESFCDWLLIEKQPEIFKLWGKDNSRYGEAARLSLEEINSLQENLKKLSAESKWNFSQGIRSLLAAGFCC